MTERIAVIEIRRLPVGEIALHPRNPRIHAEPGSKAWEILKASLAHDYFEPLVWNLRNGYLVSGHFRLKVMIEMGYTLIDVSVVDYDEHTHYARMIAANRLLGEFEETILASLAGEIDQAGLDAALALYDQKALLALVDLRGDFVLCDLVTTIIEARGRCDHIHLATLGLSSVNADALVRLRALGLVDQITLVCSHYYSKVDKKTFRDVQARLGSIARIIVARAHAKVLCIPTASGDNFVVEGSANLRSSDNTEQMVIFNDRETLEFHRAWMEQLQAA